MASSSFSHDDAAAAALGSPSPQPIAVQSGKRPSDEPQCGGEEESKECIVLDRDPQAFALLVNALRGYRNVKLTVQQLDLLEQEAQHFGCVKAWARATYHAMNAASGGAASDTDDAAHTPRFEGAGSAKNGLTLSSHIIVGLATPYFSEGNVCVHFQIERGDFVCVGMVSKKEINAQYASDFTTTAGCAGYQSGFIHTNFPLHKREEAPGFEVGDVIGMRVDFTKMRLTWTKNGEPVRIVPFASPDSVGAERGPFPVAIAVLLRKGSAVTIVE